MFSPQDGVLLSLSLPASTLGSREEPENSAGGSSGVCLSRGEQGRTDRSHILRFWSQREVHACGRCFWDWERDRKGRNIFLVYQDFIRTNSATLEGGYYYFNTIFLLVTIILVPSFYWMKKLW